MQNIENKEAAKVFLRKIFHSKELDTKIFIRKEFRRQMRPILELHWEGGGYKIVTFRIPPRRPRSKAF
jgi:hypothetical protein